MSETTETRFIKLEVGHDANTRRLEAIEDRVKDLESNNAEHIGILAKLSQTVDTLAQTVDTLSSLTQKIDISQQVFSARFNLIIGILSVIGTAVIAGVVKLLFFPG